MPMTPAAAKKYKPRRTPGSQDEVIYPETRAKMQEAKAEAADRKAAADNEAAYDLSSRVSMGDLYEKKAKGGSVGSASKRADGIASRGKTNCKMY
jgi:hypothetical protein